MIKIIMSFASTHLPTNPAAVDSVGHAAVRANLRADDCKGFAEPQRVSLYVPVEAGAIDSFVKQARSIGGTKGAKPYLHMADHTLAWVRKALA
jgi:hypothetical protein